MRRAAAAVCPAVRPPESKAASAEGVRRHFAFLPLVQEEARLQRIRDNGTPRDREFAQEKLCAAWEDRTPEERALRRAFYESLGEKTK